MGYKPQVGTKPLFYGMTGETLKFSNIGDLSVFVTSGTVVITNSSSQSLEYTTGQEFRVSRDDGSLVDEMTVNSASGTANVVFYGGIANVEEIV